MARSEIDRMPCWVAPVVAAELWGVSLEQVVRAIADGTLPSRQDCGFLVVDVAPAPAAYQAPLRQEGPRPPTYVAIGEPEPEPAPAPPVIIESEPLVAPAAILPDTAGDELPPLDEEEDDRPIGNWRQVRSSVGRTRRPPARTPPAAFAA